MLNYLTFDYIFIFAALGVAASLKTWKTTLSLHWPRRPRIHVPPTWMATSLPGQNQQCSGLGLNKLCEPLYVLLLWRAISTGYLLHMACKIGEQAPNNSTGFGTRP